MDKYILNKNKQSSESGNDYEVHNESKSCEYLPDKKNRIDLGRHRSCHAAVRTARRKRPLWKQNINGCFYCSRPCHTT